MVCKTEFHLKNNSFSDKIDSSLNDEKIFFDFNFKKNEEINTIKIDLDSKSETGFLEIFNEKNHEKSKNLATDITQLLSFALGLNIVFEKYIHNCQGQSETFNQKKVFICDRGQEIIPKDRIKQFLKKTLPIYSNLSDIEKNEIFVITNYLNQTSNSYIEDRILRMAQAWECAAKYWVKEKIVLSDELLDLREKIKDVFKIWKQEKNYQDTNEELCKKILNSLDEETNLIKLNKLISTHKLKIDEINLDLKKIKKLRDCVAHEGKITKSRISAKEAIFILLSGIQGLQLIVLKRLGYDDFVNGTQDNGIDEFGNRDRWHRTDKLAFYFD